MLLPPIPVPISKQPRGATRVAWLLALAGLLPAPDFAAPAPVGVSTVRSRLIDSHPLDSGGPAAGDAFGMAIASGDFNGDGAGDLATGVPYDDVGSGPATVPAGGSVLVHLGAAGLGLASPGGWLRLSQETGPNSPAENEFFGYTLAAGDFDHDGFDDLAVGTPYDTVDGVKKGGVTVYFGSSSPAVFDPGLALTIGGVAGDLIGAALTVGNFDDDVYEDLAVGISGRDAAAGAVFVIYGRSGGLDTGGQFLQQNNPDIEDVGEPADLFGYALAAGDFNGDGRDDLAVGVPQENDSGAAQIFFGGDNGLDLVHDQLWTQNSVAGTSESGDYFGGSLVSGDFDGDGYAELVIGSFGEDLGLSGEITNSGTVAALFGSPSGFNLARTLAWGQGGIIGLDVAETDDKFGYSLASGDFDRDGFDDLAVGHPGEAWSQLGEGAVTVLLGGASPFQQARSRLFTTGRDGVPGTPQVGTFGYSLATGDFDGDGHDDLVVGLPNYGNDQQGAEVVLYGSRFADGFDTGNSSFWSAVVP